MKKFGFSGIWQHLPTTVLGVVLVIAGIYSAVFKGGTWGDSIAIISAGAGLLGITFKGSQQ